MPLRLNATKIKVHISSSIITDISKFLKKSLKTVLFERAFPDA